MHLKANRQALRITLIYLSVALGWILVSDQLVKWLVGDADLRTELYIFNGWAFVFATGGLLYLVVRGLVRIREQAARRRKRAGAARSDAGEKLHESAACYRQLFELESDAIFLLDGETRRFLDVNQSAERLYGYTREEFLQLTLEGICDEPEPTRAMVGSGSQVVPLRWHRKKNGGRFPVEISFRVFSCQGRSLKLAAIRDTTARQQMMSMLAETAGQHSEAQPAAAGLGPPVLDLEGSRRN